MKRLCLFLFLLMITGCGTETDSGAISNIEHQKKEVSEENLIIGQRPQKDDELDSRNDSSVDYINFREKHYLNAWELSLVDTARLEKIGEVESGSRIAGGSPVYEIVGYPEKDVIAVKDASGTGIVGNITGYSIYILFEGSDRPSHYPNIFDLQVEKIIIYKGVKLIQTLQEEDIRSFQSLLDQQGPENEFQTDSITEFTALFITDNSLGYNYGILEKDGEYGLTHRESKLPTEISRFFIE
jgi:hypothetical protein